MADWHKIGPNYVNFDLVETVWVGKDGRHGISWPGVDKDWNMSPSMDASAIADLKRWMSTKEARTPTAQPAVNVREADNAAEIEVV
jgi:hypothetical protein